MAKVGRPRLPDKVSTQLRMEPWLFAKVKAIAARESRSANAQIEYFAARGVEAYEREHGPVEVPEAEQTE